MTTTDLKHKMDDFIKENDFKGSFDLLWKWVRRESTLFSSIVNYQANWKSVRDGYNQSLIDHPEKEKAFALIRKGLLDLAGDLQDSDLKEADADKISTRLLILTPNQNTENEMRLFFPFEYFRDVEFVFDETYKGLVEDTDLIIFDNFKHPEIEVEEEVRQSQVKKLDWILKNTKCFVVWFGSYGEFVNRHNDRIYAANFRFALYARINEMINFLTYYRGKKI